MADNTNHPNQLHTDLLQILDSSKRIEEILRKAGGTGGKSDLLQTAAAQAIGNRISGVGATRQQMWEAVDRSTAFDTNALLSSLGFVQAAQAKQSGALGQQAGQALMANFLKQAKDNAAKSKLEADKFRQKLQDLQTAGANVTADGTPDPIRQAKDEQDKWNNVKKTAFAAATAAAGIAAFASGSGDTYGNYEMNRQMQATSHGFVHRAIQSVFVGGRLLSLFKSGARRTGSGFGG